MRTALLTMVMLLCGRVIGHAQEFEVPKGVSLAAKEDYAKYEADIIAAAKWMEATPIKEGDQKRQEVNGFFLQWLTGSPTVSVEIGKLAQDVSDKNPQMLAMVLAGYARWVLENNYSTDKLKAWTAGVRSVIHLYQLGGDVKKNKFLQTAIEKEKDGKLEAWVEERLKKG